MEEPSPSVEAAGDQNATTIVLVEFSPKCTLYEKTTDKLPV